MNLLEKKNSMVMHRREFLKLDDVHDRGMHAAMLTLTIEFY